MECWSIGLQLRAAGCQTRKKNDGRPKTGDGHPTLLSLIRLALIPQHSSLSIITPLARFSRRIFRHKKTRSHA